MKMKDDRLAKVVARALEKLSAKTHGWSSSSMGALCPFCAGLNYDGGHEQDCEWLMLMNWEHICQGDGTGEHR